MIKNVLLFLTLLFLINENIFAQSDYYIHSKEGNSILNRRELIFNCLQSLNKDRSDKTALAICECQTNKLDRRFTSAEFKKHTSKRIININALVKENPQLEKEIQDCYRSSGKTVLLQAEGFEAEFISTCISNMQKSTEKRADISFLQNFCKCQLELIKTKKLTDEEIGTLSNSNSLLYYEMLFKCGDPFERTNATDRNWNKFAVNDIAGPLTDTVSVLNINGMSFIKAKIGSTYQVWLFDTGASDLLINKEMEATLQKENIISASNYIGIGEYEMANGMIDTCRKYKINQFQVGNYTVNNLTIAVSDKAKKIIIGKTLLNKFSSWVLNNKDQRLVLVK